MEIESDTVKDGHRRSLKGSKASFKLMKASSSQSKFSHSQKHISDKVSRRYNFENGEENIWEEILQEVEDKNIYLPLSNFHQEQR